MLSLFDTARGQVRPVEFRVPGQATMYVCGPTVYGPPHLGHGRFSLVFDIDYTTAAVCIALVFTLYFLFAGMWSTLVTAFVQYFVVVAVVGYR